MANPFPSNRKINEATLQQWKRTAELVTQLSSRQNSFLSFAICTTQEFMVYAPSYSALLEKPFRKQNLRIWTDTEISSLIFRKSSKIASRREHTASMTALLFFFVSPTCWKCIYFLLENSQTPAILFLDFVCCSLSTGLLFPQVIV